MPKSRKSKSKGSKKPYEKKADPLFPSRKRVFRIGGDVLPTGRDLGRYVKWPRYVRLQRQKKVIYQRLKVPPSVNQFTNTLNKNEATELFKLLNKYKPESKTEKKQRLKSAGESKAAGKAPSSGKAPAVVKFGLHHVTTLIEQKKAKMVVIASDVDPVELVVWIPALCKKMDVPYCIVKNKARLGVLVHQKTATCVAITKVDSSDNSALNKMTDLCRAKFNDNEAAIKTWGGGVMGLKTQAKLDKRAKAVAAEKAKMNAMLV